MIRRVSLMMSGLLASIVLMTACGVSESTGFEEIDPVDLPDRLTATTTTTTTTTTLPTSSTTPETVDVTTTVAETTTTAIATELVDVYFVLQRQIVLLEVPLPRNPVVNQVIPVLEADPSGDLTPGIRTAVPEGMLSISGQVRGVVTVELAPEFFENPEDPVDSTLAIAQIVMTITRLGGISEVQFVQNGEPTSVPLADSSLSAPDQGLNYEDYETLLTRSPPPATTTTSSTSTTQPSETPGSNPDSAETVPG